MAKSTKLILTIIFLPLMFIVGIFIKILQTIGIVKTKTWPDDIDKRKTMANLLVLQHGSYKLAESYSRFDEEQKELLKFATNSIKKIDPLRGIPLAFTHEFVATYPDIIVWWSNLSDEKQEELLENFDENDLLDNGKKIKQKYLRVIIDAYKDTGVKLECSYDLSEKE